ncbi:CRE-LIN-13 protein [Anopheles sinensis]|uniref:CRE-LIN-13 protein n=1 Tax=Anopheles sinensis TaxID=74873 RepID=A0A084VHF9_ANOSI|nr:CRE-LIN-13 protein [Anopheles sinensis]
MKRLRDLWVRPKNRPQQQRCSCPVQIRCCSTGAAPAMAISKRINAKLQHLALGGLEVDGKRWVGGEGRAIGDKIREP